MSMLLLALCGCGSIQASETSDALKQGRYEDVLKADEASLAERLEAQVQLGEYLQIVKDHQLSDDWFIRSYLAEAYQRSGNKDAFNTLVDQALAFQKQHAATQTLSAADATALARIIGERNLKVAWELVQQAHQADPAYARAYLVGAQIASGAFAWNYVLEESAAFMRLEKEDVRGMMFAARAFIADNKYPKAKQLLEQALEKNPRLVSAINQLALLALQQREQEKMQSLLDRALAVNPRSSETWALSAAAADMSGQLEQRDAFIQQACSQNTLTYEVYAIMAEAAERRYMYEESLAWGRKAQTSNPEHWQGDYIVAVNLLRLGEEPDGYALMDQAFKKNGFNVWAYNMLSVLDEDFKQQLYVLHETAYFAVKLPKSVDAQLWPYLERWLDPLFESMVQRYAFTPTGPQAYSGKVLLLFFDKHGKFSARTVGLPGLGANGATFGQVVTMPMVDRDSLQGAHPWFSTLEHEIAHVFTIQKTKRRIPRWFTEGISEWQEREPHVELDELLLSTIEAEQLPSLKNMSDGIHYPKFPMQIGLYYYLSALAVDFLIADYGFDVINLLLVALAEDKSMEQALEDSCAQSFAEIDSAYHAFVKQHATQIQKTKRYNNDDLLALQKQHLEKAFTGQELLNFAEALAQQGKVAQAQKIADSLVDDAVLGDAATILQAKIALHFARNATEALSLLSKILAIDDEHVQANYWAMRAALQEKDNEMAAVYAEVAFAGMPRETRGPQSPANVLVQIYEQTERTDDLMRVLKQQLHHDSFYYPAQRRYALLLYQAEQWADAYRELERCIQFSIYDAHTHAAIGHCQEQLGQVAEARISYKIALSLDETETIAETGLERLGSD